MTQTLIFIYSQVFGNIILTQQNRKNITLSAHFYTQHTFLLEYDDLKYAHIYVRVHTHPFLRKMFCHD